MIPSTKLEPWRHILLAIFPLRHGASSTSAVREKERSRRLRGHREFRPFEPAAELSVRSSIRGPFKTCMYQWVGEIDEILSHSHTCVSRHVTEIRSLVRTLSRYFIVIGVCPRVLVCRGRESYRSHWSCWTTAGLFCACDVSTWHP